MPEPLRHRRYVRPLTSKGQVTVPKAVRDLLGLQPGEAVAFQVDQEQRVTITRASLSIEAVYVLSSPRLYGFSRQAVRQRLLPILGLRGLHTPAKNVHLRALDLYAGGNLDFEDALLVAHMESEGITRLYSYDHHFDALAPAVERLEP